MERDSEKKTRLGLFGGTFDPVHYGHLKTAEEIHNKFKLSKTIFIPAHIPPHRKKPAAGSRHRLEMAKLAIEGSEFFEVSDTEVKREGESYSFQTIKEFKKRYTNRLEPFFIIGLDAFLEISTWKNFPDFFSESHFIVMNRPEFSKAAPEDILPEDTADMFNYDPGNTSFIHRSGFRIYYVEVTPYTISSTAIRSRIKNRKDINALLPEKVADYIKNNALYR